MSGVLRRRPTPVFNGDLVVFVPTGSRPAPTVATHTLWPLFQALNFISAPCPVPRATLAEALAGPTVGVVAWGRHLREKASAETEGGHSEFLVFTPVFRPDALDIRLTIAIRQDRGSLLAMVLSRPEYMASGEFFAASHSVSAEEQAHIDPGLAPVLWPDASGSLDFYNEHDEPSEEPASGSREHPVTSPIILLPLSDMEAMMLLEETVLPVVMKRRMRLMQMLRPPSRSLALRSRTAADLGVTASSVAFADAELVPRKEEQGATSLLQTRAFRSRTTTSVPTPFGRRRLTHGPEPPPSQASSFRPPFCLPGVDLPDRWC